MPPMAFSHQGRFYWYGPIKTRTVVNLKQHQITAVMTAYVGIEAPKLISNNDGLWVGSTCTNECKACFGYRAMSIPSDRHVPSVSTRALWC